MPRCRCAACRSAAWSWPKPPNGLPTYRALRTPRYAYRVGRKSVAYSAAFSPPESRRNTLRFSALRGRRSRRSQRCARRQLRHSLAPSMALASRAKKAAVPTAIWTQYSMIGRSQLLPWGTGCQMVRAKGRGHRPPRAVCLEWPPPGWNDDRSARPVPPGATHCGQSEHCAGLLGAETSAHQTQTTDKPCDFKAPAFVNVS